MSKPKTIDVCTLCRRVKKIKTEYIDDKRYPHGCQGKCDRCGSWSQALWALIEKPLLDRLADV